MHEKEGDLFDEPIPPPPPGSPPPQLVQPKLKNPEKYIQHRMIYFHYNEMVSTMIDFPVLDDQITDQKFLSKL